MNIMIDMNFYKDKKVLITGHTGFKGAWLCYILSKYGADVTGYSLEPPTTPSLYEIAQIGQNVRSIIGDIRNLDELKKVFKEVKPEVVFHLAAQPIVREGYKNPVYTYETNVIGTVNLLECIKESDCVKSVVNITTDKVYENKEWEWGYRENENLNGYDPYSNSKSCSELVTECYKKSFLDAKGIAVSTARAGNVIGGGDFAEDRIIPDCVRAALAKEDIVVRNPHSIRPYQHVLEPLFAYLLIGKMQYENMALAGCYNVGPDEADCYETEKVVTCFIENWGEGLNWINSCVDGPHEANYLKLDCSKIKKIFGWKPRWSLEEAIEKTVEWTKIWDRNEDIRDCMDSQIEIFLEDKKRNL